MDKDKTVGIWIRVSTEMQVKGESPEHHEKRARAYAEAKGWNIIEVYRLEAVSGKSVMAHPEAQRMMADIRNGKIKGLIFSKLARLARNTKELLEFAEFFRQYDADLISLQESIDTSTPAGRLFYTMIAAMAQWERDEIADRVAASVPIRAKLGKPLGGAAPFGYQWKDKKLVLNAEEASVRKRIYQLFLEHRRKKTVARLMNQEGYRTRNGGKFSDTTIDRLLRDPLAKGMRRANYTKSLGDNKKWVLKPEEEWVITEAEAIISEEQWNQCMAIMGKNGERKKPAKKTVHLFAGYAFCHCGAKMYAPAMPSNRTPKYICQKCKNKIPVADLEQIFQNELKNFFFSPTEIQNYLDKATDSVREKEDLLKTQQLEAEKIRTEMDRIVRLHLDGEIPKEGFGRHYHPLEERLQQLEQSIPELQGEIDFLKIQLYSSDHVITESKNLYTHWSDLEPTEKRRIVETITDRLTIGTDDISINLNYKPSSFELVDNKQRNFIPALPFCYVTRRASKLRSKAYPIALGTLGDHLRKKRLDMGIFQKDVADILGVDTLTICNWENNLTAPRLTFRPKIFDFLGNNPLEGNASSFGERIRQYRIQKGLSLKKLAQELSVDPGTLARWERGETSSGATTINRVEAFLKLSH